MSPRVSHLQTYPVKGMRAVSLCQTHLRALKAFPLDRKWALLRGEYAGDGLATSGSASLLAVSYLSTPTSKDMGHHSSKTKFHQMITDPGMASYHVAVSLDNDNDDDNDNDIITIKDAQNNSVLLTANLSTDDGVKEFEDFFAEKGRLPSATHRPRLVAAHGASFANVGGAPDEHAVVHIVAASTVKAAGEALGDPELDWRRFRPNVLVDGTAEPWEELAWCGGRIRMGSVTLEVDEPTIRCPATRVDPSTAVVDASKERMPDISLKRRFPDLEGDIFGRRTQLSKKGSYLGLYARVVEGGDVAVGDDVVVL